MTTVTNDLDEMFKSLSREMDMEQMIGLANRPKWILYTDKEACAYGPYTKREAWLILDKAAYKFDVVEDETIEGQRKLTVLIGLIEVTLVVRELIDKDDYVSL